MAEGFDIIIVGSGAGGGTLAHTLAHTGKRILILERGGFPLDEPGPAARECARCGGQAAPCLLHAKADADVIAVRPLLGMPNVTLLVDAEVTRLQTDSRGRSVTGVVVNHAGSHEVYRGGLIVLAAGAVNTAKILLSSASEENPGGLANGSGQVGRNLMCHNHIDVAAAVREPDAALFPQTLGVNDFYLGGRDARWPLGSIQMRKDAAIAFRLTTEDLPRPANRVTVDGRGRLSLAHVPTGDGVARLLYRSLRAMLSGTRMIVQEIRDRPAKPEAARYADYAGTCRFGTDPATSVLDAECKAHELDNLYVVDSSFLPSIGALSPALTVMANAIRVGEHLASRLTCRSSAREKPLRNLAVAEGIC